MRAGVFRALLTVVIVVAAHFVAAQAVSPHLARGFDADKVYAAGEVDVVNLFNGNVNVPIALGTPYSVGPRLSYQFNLMYGGNNWEHETREEWVGGQNGYPAEMRIFEWSYPSRRDNAGFGWRLTFGRLYAGGASGCFEGNPSYLTSQRMGYESPDGAVHCFYKTLHHGRSAEATADTFYTRDGSYLRLRKADTGEWKLQFPDGIVHTFAEPSGPAGTGVKKMEDPSGLDYVNIDYNADFSLIPLAARPQPPLNVAQTWKISDSIGRNHYVYFRPTVTYNETIPYEGSEISHSAVGEVVLAAWGGTYGHYRVKYYGEDGAWASLPRDAQQGLQYDNLGPTVAVALLQTVTRPTSDSYELDYDRTPQCDRCSGVLSSLRVPTGGRVEWAYENLNFPNALYIPVNPFNDPANAFTAAAVRTRTLWSGTTRLGKRTYQRTMPAGSISQMVDRLLVTDFDADGTTIVRKREHYFTACGQSCQLTILPGEYALPFARNAGGDGTGRYLSVADYGPGSNWTEIRRRSYVQYEGDVSLTAGTSDLNRRLLSERTIYDDDGGRYVDTVNSDFDGLGHYRRTTTGGNITGGADTRTQHTNFAPASGTYEADGTDTFVLPAVTEKWILGVHDSSWTKENGVTRKQLYTFDEKGLLTTRRTLANTAATAEAITVNNQKDLVEVFCYSARGFLETEKFLGGDGVTGNLPTGDLCAATVTPRATEYQIDHSWVFEPAGAPKSHTAKYRGTSLPFFLDEEFDIYTGLVSKSRDTAGVETGYEYDVLGRLKHAKPAKRAWALLEYTNATASAPVELKVTTHQVTDLTGTGTALSTAVVHYDSFGRPVQEKRRMPVTEEGAWSTTNTVYDVFSRKVSVSAPQYRSTDAYETFTPAHKTAYEYDIFGRMKKVTAPDASEVLFAYTGSRLKTTTRYLSTAVGQLDTAVETREEFDTHGRLVKVTEKSGPTNATSPIGADVTTSYTFDMADRLTGVKMAGASGGSIQTRIFDYDGRGFLRWESHPESGMTAYSYDARGNVLTKRHGAANGLFDLNYTYDGAARLTHVHGRTPETPSQFRLLKEFTFAPDNDGLNLRKGKLLTATRYNYASNLPDYKVHHVYDYVDEAGRRHGRETTISKFVGAPPGQDPWDELKTISMSQELDQEDLVSWVTYPMCVGCGGPPQPPTRQEQHVYDQGRLVSIAGTVGSGTNPITYWANGMRRALPHSNGIVDAQEVESMPRPREISFKTYDRCVAPTFLTHPVGGVGPKELSVTVTGTPPFRHTWSAYDANNEAQVVGTAPTYIAQPSVTTDYNVYVSNSCGFATSNRATITNSGCSAPTTGALVAALQPDGSWILRAHPSNRANATYRWTRLSDNLDLGSETTLAVGQLAVTTTYRFTVTDEQCGTATKTVTIEVPLSITATALTATWNPATGVQVTWPAVSGATGYVIERRSGLLWEHLVDTTANTYYDTAITGLVTGRSYAYRVYARSGTNRSTFSNADVATTMTYDNVPAGAVVTATAFNTMLDAVNKVRAASGLALLSWGNILAPSDPLPVPGVVISARHLTACRVRMTEALQALGALPRAYTDSDPVAKTIKAVYLNEVQDQTK